jgi:tetratricopeptide (TPR) repeat protein
MPRHFVADIAARIAPPAAILLLLAAISLTYFPALSGPFIFDDFFNLAALGRYGVVDDWRTFLLYLTSGAADPTGRPLSVLSFLIDANHWPAHPWGFKRTNLGIHLLNTTLLCWVLLRLGTRAGLSPAHSARAAILGAALWGLHPLWVSTTTYVIQRHAMLPLVFLLSALLLWEAAWRALERGQPARAWLLGFIGVGIASVCAVLSKANGALVPALLACVWWILYRPTQRQLPVVSAGTAKWLPRAALLVPGAGVLLALVWQIPSAMEMADVSRPWSLWQRLLSQPRALWDYLGLLWIPREGSVGIFADDFKVSTALLSPRSTLPALLGIAALLATAVSANRWAPRLSLALLFYFLGHAVESGPVALEPYFEHRNYLPAVLMFWPLAAWLTAARHEVGMVALRWGLIAILPLLLAALTFTRATVWGNSAQLAALFAERNPDSPRAQLWLSSKEINAGDYARAIPRLKSAMRVNPSSELLAMNLLHAECRRGTPEMQSLESASLALSSTSTWSPTAFQWISQSIYRIPGAYCTHSSHESIDALLDAAEQNTKILNNESWHQDVLALRGQLALSRGDTAAAKKWFEESLNREPRLDMAIWQSLTLGRYGHATLGLQHLEYFDRCCFQERIKQSGMARLHRYLLWELNELPKDRKELEKSLRQAEKNIAAQKPPAETSRRAAQTSLDQQAD